MTIIPSDVFGNIVAWFIVVPFVASLFLAPFFEKDDEMLHVYRMICFAFSCLSAFYLGLEVIGLNIWQNEAQLDFQWYGAILLAWAVAMVVCFVVSLKSLLGDAYEEADRQGEL